MDQKGMQWIFWAQLACRYGLSCDTSWFIFCMQCGLHIYQLMRLLICAILKGKKDGLVAIFGIVCSSWVAISRGTTLRTPMTPLGDQRHAFVRAGNEMAGRPLFMTTWLWWFSCFKYIAPWRVALLSLLIAARGGTFLVEQPGSSLLFHHPRMVWLCSRLVVSCLVLVFE